MASGGYDHVELKPSGTHNVGYGRNTACVRDPYYHLSKDRSYVTYPDGQDTADRLRAIRSVAEDVQKTTKTTWPFYPKPNAAPAVVSISSSAGAYVSATPGVVMLPYPYPHLSMEGSAPHSDVGCRQSQRVPAAVGPPPQLKQMLPHHTYNQHCTCSTWIVSRRLPADDPERSLQFWENSRHTAAARVAEVNEQANARVAATLPDRVHSSMWHQENDTVSRCTPPGATSAASGAAVEPEPEPEPEPVPETATRRAPTLAAEPHPPVFSAAVSQAAALYRAERQRHALSTPHVRLNQRLPLLRGGADCVFCRCCFRRSIETAGCRHRLWITCTTHTITL